MYDVVCMWLFVIRASCAGPCLASNPRRLKIRILIGLGSRLDRVKLIMLNTEEGGNCYQLRYYVVSVEAKNPQKQLGEAYMSIL